MIFYRSLTTRIIWKIKLVNMSKPWTKEGRKKRKYKKINSLVYIVMTQSSRSATNDRCVGEKEETGRACLKLKYFSIPKTPDNSPLLFYYSFGFFFLLFSLCFFLSRIFLLLNDSRIQVLTSTWDINRVRHVTVYDYAIFSSICFFLFLYLFYLLLGFRLVPSTYTII